ncbi:MAG: acyltransferase [Acidimicrobiales bacterium]|nr:acyltransferase [Acidimicrobiales bacterium]
MSDLHASLRLLRDEADAATRQNWNRSIPFSDALFDRWERARVLGFGEGSSVFDSVHVLGQVEVGEQVWVGPFVMLDGSGAHLVIGNLCDISAGVHIYTHDTARRCVSLGAAPILTAPVTIGDGTYIGSQAVVHPGVTIGSQCVIGANSFVNADVPDRTIVVGSPARPVGRVEGDGDEITFVYANSK